jgi:hypothetical protein
VNISICLAISKKSSLKLAPINRNAEATGGIMNFFLKKEYIVLYFFVLNFRISNLCNQNEDKWPNAQ